MPKADNNITRAPISNWAPSEPSLLSLSGGLAAAEDAAALTFQPEPADLIAKIIKASRIKVLLPEPDYLLRVAVSCLGKDHRQMTPMAASMGLPVTVETIEGLRHLADMLAGFGAVLDAAAARLEIGAARHAAAIGRGEG